MATFDQLSDEQRAIVELVLQQGKSYDELSDMLGIPETRVRERAREALVQLAPVSVRGVEEDWRGQLADYVLGQQAGPERRQRAATCAAPRPRAAGRARCSIRSSSSIPTATCRRFPTVSAARAGPRPRRLAPARPRARSAARSRRAP